MLSQEVLQFYTCRDMLVLMCRASREASLEPKKDKQLTEHQIWVVHADATNTSESIGATHACCDASARTSFVAVEKPPHGSGMT